MAEGQSDVLRIMENVIFLKKYTIFSDLNTEDLRAVAVIAKDIDVHDGDCVVKENDVGDSFFIIKKGELRIVKGEVGSEVELAVLKENSCFGEMVLFEEGGLRSASALARGNCRLLRIEREDFISAIMKQPGIGIEMCKIFVGRIQVSNKKILDLTRAK